MESVEIQTLPIYCLNKATNTDQVFTRSQAFEASFVDIAHLSSQQAADAAVPGAEDAKFKDKGAEGDEGDHDDESVYTGKDETASET